MSAGIGRPTLGATAGSDLPAAAEHAMDPTPRRIRQVGAILVALAVLFVVVWRWPIGTGPFSGAAHYAPLHLALETAALVVAMLVFAVAWTAFGRDRPGNVMIMGCGLAAAGLVSFAHILSFPGMPDFVTPSSTEKGIDLWLPARSIVAVTFLIVAVRPWAPLAHPRARWAILGGYLAVAAVAIWVGVWDPWFWPRTFIEGQGLTPFKIGWEYVLVAVFAMAAILFLRDVRRPVGFDALGLFAAALVSALAEAAFTLYSDASDIFNLLGHLYLVVAYLFIYRAVFVVSVREPFDQVVRAESALKRSLAERARLLAAIEQAPALVMLADRDGRIVYVNAAFERLTGDGRETVLGRDARDLAGRAPNGSAYGAMVAAVDAGGDWAGQVAGRGADGARADVEAMVSATTDETGRVVGNVMVGRDVTRERTLEAELRQVQRLEAIGRLAGGVAHDFNNMLTAIRGFAELLGRGIEAGAPQMADQQEIVRAADRAAELTRQLLAFSRRQVLRPSVIDVADVVDGVVPMLGRLLGEQIRLATLSAPGHGCVLADPAQVEQVILNLAVNARDAMPDGGTLTIRIAGVELDAEYAATHPEITPGPFVMLSVSDTGTGMDSEARARAFEPFFTTKAAGKGTGMGLATVYGIVRQSNGSIHLYSEPGLGTTFKIFLPRVPSAAAEPVRPATPLPGREGTGTVLLVEDDGAVRAFARRALEAKGYTVDAAASGAEALSVLARAEPVDVLVTDVVMPGMSGPELVMRARSEPPGLRVLYVSGLAEELALPAAVHGGDDPFLGKPFTADALGDAVHSALEDRVGAPGA